MLTFAPMGWLTSPATQVMAAVAFLPDGRVAGTADATIELWDLGRRAVTQTLRGPRGALTCLATSPHALLLVSGDSVGGIHLWDGKTEQARRMVETSTLVRAGAQS